MRARPVTGGAEVVLGKDVRGLVQPAGSTRLLFGEKTASYNLDVKVVDLEKNVAPKMLIDDVESMTAHGDFAYVGVGTQGLYEIALP